MKSAPASPRLLYTIAETSRVLDTSPSTVRRMIAGRVLSPIRLNPNSAKGKLYIPSDQILAVVNGQASVGGAENSSQSEG
jgi:hypothetical protein